MSLKDRIIRYRAKHNVSQKEFATMCGVDVMTINKIETEKSTNPTQLTKAKIEMILRKDEEEE
jgi:transcriptional regulator with XRE-family HTH domain